jgi:hypothetical protein
MRCGLPPRPVDVLIDLRAAAHELVLLVDTWALVIKSNSEVAKFIMKRAYRETEREETKRIQKQIKPAHRCATTRDRLRTGRRRMTTVVARPPDWLCLNEAPRGCNGPRE